jgi:hypothetical protein
MVTSSFLLKKSRLLRQNGVKPRRHVTAAPADLAAAARAQRHESNDAAILINHFPSKRKLYSRARSRRHWTEFGSIR